MKNVRLNLEGDLEGDRGYTKRIELYDAMRDSVPYVRSKKEMKMLASFEEQITHEFDQSEVVRPWDRASVCASVRPPVCTSVRPSVHPSIRPSIHIFRKYKVVTETTQML